MVDNPYEVANSFIMSGADSITFHLEAMKNYEETVKLIEYLRSKYIKVGISIKPNTPTSDLKEYLNMVDLILIMSVEPGFGGQEFIDSSIQKVQVLNNYRKRNNLQYAIEVDGGVNDRVAHELKNVGADIVVAGSYIFKGDIKTNIKKLNNA